MNNGHFCTASNAFWSLAMKAVSRKIAIHFGNRNVPNAWGYKRTVVFGFLPFFLAIHLSSMQ